MNNSVCLFFLEIVLVGSLKLQAFFSCNKHSAVVIRNSGKGSKQLHLMDSALSTALLRCAFRALTVSLPHSC